MNLSPQWLQVLAARGHECHHWSQVGQGDDPDESLLVWAHTHGAVLITADLDFGLLLARSGQRSPSLVQNRSKGTLPEDIAESLVEALRTAEPHLSQGALVTVEPERHRVRILPIGPPT